MTNVILDILSNKNKNNNNFSLFRTASPRLLAVKNSLNLPCSYFKSLVIVLTVH